MDEEEEEIHYSLVIPFVVCKSQDGPYDDNAFVAGVRYGRWAELLKLQPTQHAEYEPNELVPQLDLLAMHHRYKITIEPWEDGNNEWSLVTMTRGE